MKPRPKLLLALACAAALFALGRWSARRGDTASADAARDPAHATDTQPDAPTRWTCPMHAQIILPDPGDCPICGMDLVPMVSDDDEAPRRITLSPAAKALAQVEVTAVQRHDVTRPVRMVGKVAFDETALRTISAWIGGRLDRLFVDYTGVRVAAGDHLVELYSPDLLSAQEELLSAHARIAATSDEASTFLAESNQRAYAGAREKLLLWGLTEAQVAAIEARGTAEDRVQITSPSSGVVVAKLLEEGAYVKTGTPIYRIADLSRLWVQLDAYEQDLAWLRYGQAVTLEVEALPGETVEGQIAYIDPLIDQRTRTAKVRVNVDNTLGRLKPGMFVRGVARSRVGAGGRVLDRFLAGKWVSPMHPEIVKDGPGVCDVCGMDLVPAESLGLVDSALTGDAPPPIVVPATAVLVTGKRAVVYVEVPGQEKPTYEGREVVLGPRAGDEYVVLDGLADGERVVVNGAFRLDSSMQIRAKPSMLSMPGETASAGGSEARVTRAALTAVFDAYLALQTALAADELAGARESAATLLAAVLGATKEPELTGGVTPRLHGMHGALLALGEAPSFDALRAALRDVSIELIAVEALVGHAHAGMLRVVHCPMAFDDTGADWIQADETVANPYFGAEMLRCGAVTRVLPAQ